jgi:CheY-like chemotaxis protein
MWPFGSRPTWPRLSLDEIRKRSRLLVVDDAEFAYVELFKRDGYTIDKWNDVDDLAKMESGYFDVILLDMKGIARAQSKDQGLGLIRHLKDVRPMQLIVAFSSADFSLKYKEFFDRADGVLAKGADYVEFKQLVDSLLVKRFDLEFYLARLDGVGASYGVSRKTVRSAAERSVREGKPRRLQEALERAHVDKDAVAIAIQVIQAAIGIAGLLKP